MYYFFPGAPFHELEAEKLMGNSLGGVHTHDMLLFIVSLIVWLENHPPVQRCSSLPVLYNNHQKSKKQYIIIKIFAVIFQQVHIPDIQNNYNTIELKGNPKYANF